ncbi:MAG: UDP-galactopyranose mutase, partial [Alphaproteobacteria bacterium]
IPYYPIRLVAEKAMLGRYVERAEAESGVTFVGRLGTYAYLDMDVTIGRALETVDAVLPMLRAGRTPPVFVHRPL